MKADVAEKQGRRGTTKTALALAALVALVGLPIGYAIGQEDSPAPPNPEAATRPTEPASPEKGEVAYYAEGAPPERVAACETDPSAMGDPLVCELLLAVNDGRLEPGSYSKAEIEEQKAIREGLGK